jgi:MFS family permease
MQPLNAQNQVSVYYLGTLVGCLVGGWFGDRYGRIKCIALGAAWAILGASLQSSAQNATWMIIGKTHAVHRLYLSV